MGIICELYNIGIQLLSFKTGQVRRILGFQIGLVSTVFVFSIKCIHSVESCRPASELCEFMATKGLEYDWIKLKY